MIKVRVVKGPLQGRSRAFTNNVAPDGVTVDPVEFLVALGMRGSEWVIEMVNASLEEHAEWVRADMAARIVRSLLKGLPVMFADKTYRARNRNEVLKVAARVQRAMIASSKLVSIAQDDGTGIHIQMHEPRTFH